MAAFSTIALVVGAGISAYGFVQQQEAMDDAKAARAEQTSAIQGQAAEQRAQFAAQQRVADIKNARERAEMIRKGRVATAQVVNSGAANNVMGSSGVIGGTGSIATQTATNLGVFGAIAGNQVDILESQRRQGDYAAAGGIAQGNVQAAQGDMAMGQSIFNLGGKIFDAGGGWKTVFDTAKK